ncbi:MAG: hypothetical protein HYY84_05985 [Deltaproteobacteria bacterium]|nr:hypothetical protein [Deltaproteobacteria bacterium]
MGTGGAFLASGDGTIRDFATGDDAGLTPRAIAGAGTREGPAAGLSWTDA